MLNFFLPRHKRYSAIDCMLDIFMIDHPFYFLLWSILCVICTFLLFCHSIILFSIRFRFRRLSCGIFAFLYKGEIFIIIICGEYNSNKSYHSVNIPPPKSTNIQHLNTQKITKYKPQIIKTMPSPILL